MSNALITAGAQPAGASKWAPIYSNEFFSGLYTNRNPLRDPATPFLYNKFYSATRYEAIWAGLNAEISPRLTLIRAPGHSVFNSNSFPAVLDFYSFKVTGVNFPGYLRVFADTATALYDITGGGKTLIYTKSAGAGQSRMLAVGNTLYIGNGVDQLQLLTPSFIWIKSTFIPSGAFIVDLNQNVQQNLGYATACSNIAISGGVLTASVADLTNILPGRTVQLEGMVSSFLNGLQVTVLTSGSGVFTANISYSGTLSEVESTGLIAVPGVNGTTGTVLPSFSASFLGLTLDNNSLWLNNGPATRNWGIPAPTAAPTVSNALNTTVASSWVTATYFMPVLPLMELGGYIYQATTVGVTNGSVPSFNHTTPHVSTTTDGSVVWTYQNVAARQTNHAYVFGDIILVTWSVTVTIPGTQTLIGYNQITGKPIYQQGPPTTQTTTYTAFFRCTLGGTNGAALDSQLSWSSALGTVVTDGPNGVQWTNVGLAVTRTSGSTSAPAIVSGTLAAGVIGNSQAVAIVNQVLDTNGAVETVQTAGQTGTLQPTWATASGSTTQEKIGSAFTGLVWSNAGSSPAVGGSAAGTGTWVYTYAYEDLITGSVGPAAPLSAAITLATDSFIQVQGLNPPASLTTSIGQINIYRSTVGQTVPFLIGTIPNNGAAGGTWTYNDYSPDEGLPGSTMNNLIQADLSEDNAPPPAGFLPICLHLSSIWGFVGSTLYYSFGGNVTNQLGGFEAFPPNNYIQFQSNGVVGWGTNNGLYVILNDSIQLVSGTQAPFSPSQVVPIGILSPNCFALNGQSPFLYTSDRQILGVDPSAGIAVDGFPIGDILAKAPFSPSTAYLAWYVNGTDQRLFASDGQTGYYNMLNSIAPEAPSAVWSPQRVIAAGCSAVKAVETTPGNYQLLVGPKTAGPILYRDTSSALDNGVAYPAWVIVGSNVLCHPGQIAELGFIHVDSVKTGTAPLISILLDEIYGYPGAPNFDALSRWTHDPPRLPPAKSMYSNRHYVSQTGKPAWCRHLQIKIDFAAENALSEVLSFTLFGAIHIERTEVGR